MRHDSWLDDVYEKTNSELYDEWKDYHQKVIVEMGWQCAKYAAEMIKHETNVIADIGCGNGQVGLEAPHLRFDGYDINQPMLDRFMADNYNEIHLHDITESPLPKQYDTITAIGVLTRGHVRADAAKNLADSLTPNGKIICSMPEEWLENGGWNDQEYLVITDQVEIHSLTTETGYKQYHQMITWQRK